MAPLYWEPATGTQLCHWSFRAAHRPRYSPPLGIFFIPATDTYLRAGFPCWSCSYCSSLSSYTRRLALFAVRALPKPWEKLRHSNTAQTPKRGSQGAEADTASRIAAAVQSSAQEYQATKAKTMIYVVSYTLRPKRDAASLVEELKRSVGWAHNIDETWLVATKESAQQLYTRLSPFLSQTDSILIAELTRNATYQGWLPKETWDWITNTRNVGY